jgi:hypothetical protein
MTVCFALAISSAVAAQQSRQESKLANADWSVKASPNLAEKPPAEEIVEAFVRAQEARVQDDLIPDLCSFKFADLRHNGNLSLIAGDDISGRGLCYVIIIDKSGTDFTMSSIRASYGEGNDVVKLPVDLKNDGNLELVTYGSLGRILGQCGAFFPFISAWTGDGYDDVSYKFMDYYRQQLDSTVKEVADSQSQIGTDGQVIGDKECREAEVAALQRYLGVAPDAGLAQAIRLSTSRDREARTFAVELLAAIGGSEAQAQMAKLAKDPDSAIAYEAKYYLPMFAKGPIPFLPGRSPSK